MEYITGVTTLQAIFTIHWLAYCAWYKGVIRPTVYENIKNLRGVVSVIAKLCWYINIGARLLEVGLSVKYIGRYTKKPVIAEARIIRCDRRWVIFKFKDYAEGGNTSIKKMGVFTFITYLTQHIQDKYFRVVRGYGLFSNRLKGKLLKLARKLLNEPDQKENLPPKTWRE